MEPTIVHPEQEPESWQTMPLPFKSETVAEEDRVYWNEPDGLVIKKSEYGGILPRDWETSREKLNGRFFYPDGSSLTWDVCARDKLRDFNMVCLKCGDSFVCAANNMTRTGNRHIRSRHPSMKCIQSPIPFYKMRTSVEPKLVERAQLDVVVTTTTADGSQITEPALTAVSSLPFKSKIHRCSDLDRRRLDRYVASVLARCQLPASVMDNPIFREMLGELTNLEYVPCLGNGIEREHEKMYKIMIQDLRSEFPQFGQNAYFSIVADCWPVGVDASLVVVNLHCMTPKWHQFQASIGARTVPSSKVSAAILDVFIETFHKELGLPPDRISSIVVNHFQDTKVWKLSKDYPLFHYQTRCPIHLVQLAVKQTLNQLDLSALLRKAACFLGYMHANPSIQYVLAELSLDQNLECTLDLLSDKLPDYRLDSELLMLSVLYQMRGQLVDAWREHKIPSAVMVPSMHSEGNHPNDSTEVKFEFSEAEWVLIEQLVVILSRVERFNIILGKYDNASLSKVYPAVLSLYRFLVSDVWGGAECSIPSLSLKHWDSSSTHDSIKYFKQCLATNISAQFPGVGSTVPIQDWYVEDRQVIEPYLIAMALDPSICNSFQIFANPLRSAEENASFIAGIASFAHQSLEKAAQRVRSQWLYSRQDQMSMPSSGNNVQSILSQSVIMNIPGPVGDDLRAQLRMNSFGDNLSYDDRYRDVKTLEAECQELFSELTSHPSMVDFGSGMLELFGAEVQHWKDSGGWEVHRNSPEVHWWEQSQARYVWMSRVAMIFFSMPASTVYPYRMPPNAVIAGTNHNPDNSTLQSILLRENFYFGMLEVSSMESFPSSKKRRRSSTGQPTKNEIGASETIESTARHAGKFLSRWRATREMMHNEGSDSLRRDSKAMHIVGMKSDKFMYSSSLSSNTSSSSSSSALTSHQFPHLIPSQPSRMTRVNSSSNPNMLLPHQQSHLNSSSSSSSSSSILMDDMRMFNPDNDKNFGLSASLPDLGEARSEAQLHIRQSLCVLRDALQLSKQQFRVDQFIDNFHYPSV